MSRTRKTPFVDGPLKHFLIGFCKGYKQGFFLALAIVCLIIAFLTGCKTSPVIRESRITQPSLPPGLASFTPSKSSILKAEVSQPASSATQSDYSCCPSPPAGYDCYEKPQASPGAINAVPFAWYMDHGAIAVKHWADTNKVYEVQYCHELGAGWFAYSRVTLAKADWLTSWCPIYSCDSRFYRVTSN